MSTTFTIPASLSGERIDRSLALLCGLTRSEVAAIIEDGRVRIGGSVVAVRHRKVQEGEELVAELDGIAAAHPVLPAANASVPFEVVYEDEALLIVNKPPGVVVHPGAGHHDDTLVSGLLAAYPDLATDDTDPLRPGIVHRLDKDTSGLLVVARNAEVRRTLQAQLAERTMGRTYLTLVRGPIANDEGVIEAPIGRSLRDPTKMAIRQAGRSARTRYAVLDRFATPADLTYLEVQLDTGRTHQIRVHLQAIGHPVAGDSRYGGALGSLGLRRPFLHAWRLDLVHPVTGASLQATAPLPEDLKDVLARCS